MTQINNGKAQSAIQTAALTAKAASCVDQPDAAVAALSSSPNCWRNSVTAAATGVAMPASVLIQPVIRPRKTPDDTPAFTSATSNIPATTNGCSSKKKVIAIRTRTPAPQEGSFVRNSDCLSGASRDR